MTNEQGIINATQWISVTPDLRKSVIFNMEFDNYNQTAMAHRPGTDGVIVAFPWMLGP